MFFISFDTQSIVYIIIKKFMKSRPKIQDLDIARMTWFWLAFYVYFALGEMNKIVDMS